MKILISNDNYNAHYFIRMGLAQAFAALGHECILWDIKKKSCYDAFDSFEPDIFLGQTYNLTEEVIECICERPHLKVVLRAFDNSKFSRDVEEKYPIGIASNEEVYLTNKLRTESGRSPLLHNHYVQKSIDKTHEDWINDGYKVISNLNAANLYEYANGVNKKEYESDICFIGGRWGYKSQTLDPYLISLCNPKHNLNIKIFGNTGWGIPQYCGQSPPGVGKDLLASAKICPNISEPHSQVYGHDIIERPFKILSNKGFCISDSVSDLEELIPDGIIYATTPEDFEHKVYNFLYKEKDRKEIAEIGHKAVMKSHTYLDRVQTIFKELNLYSEYEACTARIPTIKDQICKS